MLLLFWNDVSISAQASTTITLAPSSQDVLLDDLTSVEIRINNIQDAEGSGLYGADVRLSFDKRRLAVQDDDGFQSGIQITPGPLLTSGSSFILFNTADNSAATIKFVITQLNPTPPIANGNGGVLATIHFKAIGSGTAAVDFTYTELANRNGFTIPASVNGGRVTIFAPIQTQTPTPMRTRTPTLTRTPTSTVTPTGCPNKPGKPTLIAPPNKSKVNKRAVFLNWNDVICATYYKVLVREGSQSGPEVDQNNNLLVSEYTTVPLTAGQKYFWVVNACNTFGCTGSAWWQFKIKANATLPFISPFQSWLEQLALWFIGN